MFSKIFFLLVVVAYIHAKPLESIDYYAEPKYEFKYGVEDPHTGDRKSQSEIRDGDKTQGEYSVVEPDGTILTVKYTVVGKSGFNALVTRSGKAIYPIAPPSKIIATAPVAIAPAKVLYSLPAIVSSSIKY